MTHSPEPGRWRNSRVPYLTEIMDSVNDPRWSKIVCMKGSQTGLSEALINILLYWANRDPRPIMIVWPTEQMARENMKTRVDPSLEPVPEMQALLGKSKKRGEQKATNFYREFPGGYLVIAWANSASKLSSQPIPFMLMDEIDRYPLDVQGQGNPIKLAEARTQNYWNRKIVYASTPTTARESRIAPLYYESTRDQFHVPCWHCETKQVLEFSQIQFEFEGGELDHTSARYQCINDDCLKEIDGGGKLEMLTGGKWIMRNPESDTRGFHVSRLYSPWSTWQDIALEFKQARGDVEANKTFYNLQLGEVWVEQGDRPAIDRLMARREDFGDKLPSQILRITMGVDCQNDHVVYEIVGFGTGQESWSLECGTIAGDPMNPIDACLKAVAELSQKTFVREDGGILPVRMTFIDARYATDSIKEFCAENEQLNIFAAMGVEGDNHREIITGQRRRPTLTPGRTVRIYSIGDSQLKNIIYHRLNKVTSGPGYDHFPIDRSEDYFRQLTAEHKRQGRKQGQLVWHLPDKAKNDFLDCRKYALAALTVTGPIIDDREDEEDGIEQPPKRNELDQWLTGSRGGAAQSPFSRL